MAATIAPPLQDWQVWTENLKSRGKHLLDTGLWSDCQFVVGIKPNQETFKGHSLLLGMSSPVFEGMFFGTTLESEDIVILDVSTFAFKTILKYIYTDEIDLTSVDQACELYYGAKLYKLLHLQKECIKYIKSILKSENVCKAYKFAKLHNEAALMQESLEVIRKHTQSILEDESFYEADFDMIITIFDQDYLKISSEVDLFNALTRYADYHGMNHLTEHLPIKQAIMKIRFLTLTPQQFTVGPATSNLLTESEKLNFLMKISSPESDIELPIGFSMSKISRQPIESQNILFQIVDDLIIAEKSGQWLLSCYGPFKGKPNLPEFEDQSFEEVRNGYYEAKCLGTVDTYKQQFKSTIQSVTMKLKSLQRPSPEVIANITNIYSSKPNSPDLFSEVFSSGLARYRDMVLQGLLVSNNNALWNTKFGNNLNSAFSSQSNFGFGQTDVLNSFASPNESDLQEYSISRALQEGCLFGNNKIANNSFGMYSPFVQQSHQHNDLFEGFTSPVGSTRIENALFSALQNSSQQETASSVFGISQPLSNQTNNSLFGSPVIKQEENNIFSSPRSQ